MSSWTALTVAQQTRACRPPFSFYFDLIQWLWRSKSSNPQPIHRLCTLARKQRATFLVIEPAFGKLGVDDEIDALDKVHGGGGTAEAVSISFFATEGDDFDVLTVGTEALVGSLTLINYKTSTDIDFSLSYVHDAVFRRPIIEGKNGDAKLLPNNYTFSSAKIGVEVGGENYEVDGVYYCQQNGVTHRCAQACLRMTLNTITSQRHGFSALEINKLSGAADPSSGLTLKELIDTIDSAGLSVKAHVIPCESLTNDQFITNIAGFVESGVNALIVFSTSSDQHVVTCFGYTQNTDEWHPQALPAYSGPASSRFFASALWTDHLVIHDDNFGPYFTLNSRALRIDPTIKPEWIIALAPKALEVSPAGAQALASVIMSQTVPNLLGRGQWFTFIKQGNSLVYRPTLVDKESYLRHLRSIAHDGTQLMESEISYLSALPDIFWMVEFSTPSLYTGNHSKLGEVIINAYAFDVKDIYRSALAIRMPSLILLPHSASGQFTFHQVAMLSHIPILNVGDHPHRW